MLAQKIRILSIFPMAMTLLAQDPGVYRTRIGRLEITALLDGQVPLGPELIKGLDRAEAEKLLGGTGPVLTSVNAFLVDTGKARILVDAGGTSAWGLGHLAERLQKAGIPAASIDAVLITHLHGDHFGGLLSPEGKRAFPKAQLRISQAEEEHWLSPATEAAQPEARKPILKAIKATLACYRAEGAYRPFAPGEAPFPGVKAIPTPGHTPGHTAYAFESGGTPFWAVGDTVHFGPVQFPKPSVTVAFDSDEPRAAASRLELWERAVREQAVIGASHLAFPGLGRVAKAPQGYTWVPLERP